MKETVFVHATSGTRPSLASRTLSLPPDLAQDAIRRLRWFALVSAAVLGFFLLASWLLPGTHSFDLFYGLLMLVGILCSMGLAYLCTRDQLAPAAVLQLAAVYQLFVGAIIALSTNAGEWPNVAGPPGWSPLAVWVAVFPLVVPLPPRRALLVAAATVVMDPLSVVVLAALDQQPLPALEAMIRRFLPDLVAVAISVVVARMLYHIGRTVSAARELGSYRLQERLGGGGMGEVWRASHRMLARPAAVKLIHVDALGNAEQTAALHARFEREAQATASLCSPHTIDVYDFGISQAGEFYYVMELLHGIDLDRLVRRFGPQPPSRVIALLWQACHSLDEAHQIGLVHRDIKPANLFLCHYGADYDFLKILDFGLVKDQRRSAEEGSESISGTPAFLAPEAATAPETVDHRADLYSLGCVAYWLLTGTNVFESATLAGMLYQHVGADPEPPSARLGREVPAELERMVMRCLAKRPEDRYPSARALQGELDRATVPLWTADAAEAWWRTHLPTLATVHPDPGLGEQPTQPMLLDTL